MTSEFRLQKEKYLQLAQCEGVPAALTRLQDDIIQGEIESFEGEKGYQPQMWNDLDHFREFSRELWEAELLKEDA